MVKYFGVILAVVLAMISMEAMAVEMEAQIGFGSKCRLGSWTPYTVTINNDDKSPLSGVITTIDSNNKQPNPWQSMIELSGPSEKRYSGCVIQNSSTSDETLKLLVTHGKRLPADKDNVKCPVQQIYPNSVLIVAVGQSKSTLNFLDGAALRNTPKKSGSSSQALPISIAAALTEPETLPERPLGYDSVDVLVLSDMNPGQMDPKQLTAIKMWVASGGTLVVNGGANHQRYKNDFYSGLLPVDVTGVAELGLSPLASRYGFSINTAAVVVTSGRLKPGAAEILAQNGTPLISCWNYGLGQVYFLAFDYSGFPLRGWDGQENMWKNILFSTDYLLPLASPLRFTEGEDMMMSSGGTIQPSVPPIGQPQPNQSSSPYKLRPHRNPQSYRSGSNGYETIASTMPSIGMPSAQVIILYLVLYLLFLVPINYYILTKKNRRELAWITTPAIILVFTIGAYGIGFAMKGTKLLLKTVTVVEAGPNAKFASMTTYGALFSPSRRSYDIKVDDPYAVVSETPDEIDSYSYYHGSGRPRSGRRSIKFLAGESTIMPGINMDMWSMRTFRSESGCGLGGSIDADLVLDNPLGSVRGTIKNNTAFDIVDCRIVMDKQTSFDIGDMPRGTQQQVDEKTPPPAPPKPGPGGLLPPPLPATPSGMDVSPDLSPLESARESMKVQLTMDAGQSKRPALIGRIKQTVSNITLEHGREERQSIDYFIYWLDDKGGRVR